MPRTLFIPTELMIPIDLYVHAVESHHLEDLTSQVKDIMVKDVSVVLRLHESVIADYFCH